ncbi:transcription termination factor NusA [Vermiphilus pyriformis]|nr:MAG: transcription termination factor NusA [Vermiphilus pyriformis]
MMRLGDVIEELVEERGLDRSVLGEVICEGMVAAYSKRYPDVTFKAHYERKSDELIIEVEKEVVPTVEDEDTQISLKKAKIINPSAEIGSRIVMPFDGKIGRIEILRAKQIIAQRIRKIESDAVYEQFKDKENTIVHGLIHKCERNGVVVKLQDHLAFLPKSLCIPTDKCIVGYPIRALLKEVLQEPRNDNQLILDRVSDTFLLRLFELEIPEIYDHIVEVKKIVRTAGYKSKIAVTSNDENVDAVGTCVGIKGARIQPILKELGGEKIDVIHWSDHKETLIKDALKPAIINRVELIDQDNAQVWLDDDQRSLAIGKMGQNINLASQLAGISIHLVTSESSSSTENSSLT